MRGCSCRGTAARFAHVSCLAEQDAKVLFAEAGPRATHDSASEVGGGGHV